MDSPCIKQTVCKVLKELCILRDCCYSVKGRSIKNRNVNVSPEVALLRAINQSVLKANIKPKRELTLRVPGLEVIKLEVSLRLKKNRNDWLLADTCPQAANHCTLF